MAPTLAHGVESSSKVAYSSPVPLQLTDRNIIRSMRKRKGLKFYYMSAMPLKKRDLKDSPQKDFTLLVEYGDDVQMMSDEGSLKEPEKEKDQKDINATLQQSIERLNAAFEEQKSKINQQDLKIDRQNLKIERRDLKIEKQDSKIRELEENLEQKDLKISELEEKREQQDLKIEKQGLKIQKQDSKIRELEEKVEQRDLKISELEEKREHQDLKMDQLEQKEKMRTIYEDNSTSRVLCALSLVAEIEARIQRITKDEAVSLAKKLKRLKTHYEKITLTKEGKIKKFVPYTCVLSIANAAARKRLLRAIQRKFNQMYKQYPKVNLEMLMPKLQKLRIRRNEVAAHLFESKNKNLPIQARVLLDLEKAVNESGLGIELETIKELLSMPISMKKDNILNLKQNKKKTLEEIANVFV